MANVVLNVTQTIQAAFPGVPVIPCLGNEDSLPDYVLPPRYMKATMTNDDIIHFQKKESARLYTKLE